MKSFMSWKGGKFALIGDILPRFPLEYAQYIEVFGGAAWIYFAKQPEKHEIYNDLNSDLYNLFLCVKERTIALLAELGFMPLCGREEFYCLRHFLEKKEFDSTFMQEELELAERYFTPPESAEIRDILTKKALEYDVKRAAAFFKVIRYSYGRGCTSYACQGIDLRNFFHLIWQASRRMQRTNIENRDFETVIRQYDSSGAFFYLDPPYFDAEDYAVEFPPEDHTRLRDLLSSIEGKFLLSYNDEPFIRELYRDFQIVELERLDNLALCVNPGQMYRELLIANYDMNEREREQPQQMGLF